MKALTMPYHCTRLETPLNLNDCTDETRLGVPQHTHPLSNMTAFNPLCLEFNSHVITGCFTRWITTDVTKSSSSLIA